MGKAKKEKNRIAKERNQNGGAPLGNNLKVKGENFYRDAKKVKFVNMLKGGKPIRNVKGKIIKPAPYQSRDVTAGRVQPDRRWFGKKWQAGLFINKMVESRLRIKFFRLN